jgi:hypothetical protein
LSLAARNGAVVDTDDSKRAQCDRYRAIADALRLVVSKMKHAEAAEELRLLAVSYERLAEYAESAPYAPKDIEGALP